MRALEAEGSFPGAGFARGAVVGGERELRFVVVPAAEEVDGADVGGGAEGEGQLDGWGRHCCGLVMMVVVFFDDELLVRGMGRWFSLR